MIDKKWTDSMTDNLRLVEGYTPYDMAQELLCDALDWACEADDPLRPRLYSLSIAILVLIKRLEEGQK